MILHTKSNTDWRKQLYYTVFNLPIEKWESHYPNAGIIGSKKWMMYMRPGRPEYERHKYNLTELGIHYGINIDRPWKFVGGTVFACKFEIIKFIANHNPESIYDKLNSLDTVDVNWLKAVKQLKRDPRGAGNDMQYRWLYDKPLLPDFMIEHAFERIFGLITNHLNLDVVGI